MDTAAEATITWSSLFFSLRGRINRAKFWLGILVVHVLAFGLLFLVGAIDPPPDPPAEPGLLWQAAGFLILVLLVLGPIPIAVKRLHDMDRSGWWYLVSLIPVVGGLILLLWLGSTKGTIGLNKYGPDPLARTT